MQKKVTILGINGGFGRLFSVLLSNEEQLEIVGVDLQNELDPSGKCLKYIQADLTVVSEEINALLKSSDLIIICLPEDIAYNFFLCYQQQISQTALLIDTLSVKSTISSIYLKNNFNALSLNPMFGPDLKMNGKNIIVIKFNDTSASDFFIDLLKTWKLELVYLTADEHDKMTSMVQVATHAAIITFGAALKEFDVPLADLLKVATPPFLVMSALFARIASGKPKVYWNIQNENIYASEARKLLIKNLISLDKSIIDNQEDFFYKLVDAGTAGQQEAFRELYQNLPLLFKQ